MASICGTDAQQGLLRKTGTGASERVLTASPERQLPAGYFLADGTRRHPRRGPSPVRGGPGRPPTPRCPAPAAAAPASPCAFQPRGGGSLLPVSASPPRLRAEHIQVTPSNCVLLARPRSAPCPARRIREDDVHVRQVGNRGTRARSVPCPARWRTSLCLDSECAAVREKPSPSQSPVITWSLNIFIEILCEHFTLCRLKMRIKR